MRLRCTIWQFNAKRFVPVSNESKSFESVSSTIGTPPRSLSSSSLKLILPGNSSERKSFEFGHTKISKILGEISVKLPCKASLNLGNHVLAQNNLEIENSLFPERKPVPVETFHILNDLVVDRGPSPFMSQLELYVDDIHLTTVQADGLVVSTPTGSTAYSLSAGGSLVHPECPAILITPICPHTLNFRPFLLPDSAELKIQIPSDSRSTAWVSFDGRHRTELKQGDFIILTMSHLPMPTVCMEDQSSDWFESLRRCLHWNERTRQKALGTSQSPVGTEFDDIFHKQKSNNHKLATLNLTEEVATYSENNISTLPNIDKFAFQLFANKLMKTHKSKNPESSNAELFKLLKNEWYGLPASEKEDYLRQADELNE
ncbi:hypothetical protein HK096_007333, partial [Nowakowskiella sp. JEL0078]